MAAHNNKEVLDYWNTLEVESMYDKNLLRAEISLIKKHLMPNSKILDAGCGEGEGTIEYAKIPGVKIHAADFSDTRLQKAAGRLYGVDNVTLVKADFLEGGYNFDRDYDAVVSQRFLINLMEWELQKKVLLDLMGLLKEGGRLIMLEGSVQGTKSLNDFREACGQEPIPVKWHNLFFDDTQLVELMIGNGFEPVAEEGLGAYFLLTRGIRPLLDKGLNWDSKFNEVAAGDKINELLDLGVRFSRLKLRVFQK